MRQVNWKPGNIICLAALLLLPVPDAARADWINLTGAETSPNIAEITVLDDRVKIRLEIYVGNLEAFSDLVPDSLLQSGSKGRRPLAERLQHFSANVMTVLGPDGKPLPLEAKLIEPRLRVDRRSPYAGMINPQTRRKVPEPPTDKRVLFAELDYPFEGQPANLTFVPPRDGEGNSIVSLGFIAYHKAVPIIDFRYLSAPAKVNLDWNDAWYSVFENKRLKRHHKSALMSFLYIEPNEVRHEVLARITDLKNWLDLGLAGDRFVEPAEMEPLKRRVGAFLDGKNPVLIDGKPGNPIVDRINFVRVSLNGIKIVEVPERLEQSTAIIGVILAYIVPGLPQKVSVDWELFTDQIQRVPAMATDPAGPLRTFLEPDDNKHVWRNFLKKYRPPTITEIEISPDLKSLDLPLLSLALLAAAFAAAVFPFGAWRRGERPRLLLLAPPLTLLVAAFLSLPFGKVKVANPLAGTPVPAPELAAPVAREILANIYRAFDFRREEDVYDKLALTVTGDQLTEIYLQNRQAMVLKSRGGAQARVKAVEMVAIDKVEALEDGTGFKVRARWTVDGSVGHWGHIHQRRNLYAADLSIREVAGHWKLSKFDLIKEERVNRAVSPVAVKK